MAELSPIAIFRMYPGFASASVAIVSLGVIAITALLYEINFAVCVATAAIFQSVAYTILYRLGRTRAEKKIERN